MNNFNFHNPTEIIFGKGSIEKLPKKIRCLGTKVLLVYGGGSIKRTGLYDQVILLLKKNKGIKIFELGGVEPNPRLSTVHKGIEICKKQKIEFIIAVGGGSTVDAAKAIALGACYDGDVWDFYSKKAVPEKGLPLGVILTNAATGSEMNGRSVITNWEQKLKYSVKTIYSYPLFSILDPVLTFTVPRQHLVYGIVDTLAHVFEQYFSPTDNCPLQDRFCESVMKTVIENAPKALVKPDNYEVRANLMLCSTFALNETLGMGREGDFASHRIEHELSAEYDIPHGGGLAIITPRWMEYVMNDCLDKFIQFAIRVWDINSEGKTGQKIAQKGIEEYKRFLVDLGAPTRLSDYGINRKSLKKMARKAVSRGPLGGIRKLYEEDVIKILEACL